MTTSTLAALAAAVEAGLLAGAGCCQDIQMEGYKYTSEENTITNAQAALAEYRRRCEALEAFVERVAKSAANRQDEFDAIAYDGTWQNEEKLDRVRAAYLHTLRNLGDEARTLLAATGGESGESEVGG